MAELNARIIAKASGTAGEAPQAADLVVGEIAVNTADGKFFTKHTDGTIKEISGSGGGGSISLNDITDCSYVDGSFEPTGLDQIVFSSSDVPTGETYKIYANPSYGLRIGAFDENSDGSFVSVEKDQGVTLKAEYGHIWLQDDTSDGQPELRWTSGNPHSAQPTGNYFGLKLPSGYSVDQTYVLPSADGTAGQVLSTNGSGVLSWATSSGGGGGAVDSVNGQTGVVSLGVQDMDDFDYNYAQANIVTLNRTASSQDFCNADGEFSSIANNNNSVGDHFTYYGGFSDGSGGGSDKAEFDKLVAGDPLTFVFDNGATHTTTFVTKGHNIQQEWYMTVADDFPAEALSSQTLQVANPKFSASTDLNQAVPLAEGDIIKWDNTDQKFKPAQAKDRIQDMDDFALEQTPPVQRTWIGKWYRSGLGNNSCQTASYLGRSSDGANFSRSDADGNDWESTVTGIPDGTTLFVRINSGEWQEFVMTTARSTFCNPNDSFQIDSPALKTLVDNASVDDVFEVSDGTDQPTDIQLVEGDILVWDASDEKFKPASNSSTLDELTDVSVPNPTPGQVLTWNDPNSRWEAASLSAGGLPVGEDGKALIWENGQWVAGPMIGGVDYTGGDDYFSDVSVLLHMDGVDGSVNFVDSSSNNLTIGTNNQAQIKTDQSKFGGASAYFDGDTDYLVIPAGENLAMGTNDFTVECFYRPTSKAATYPRIVQFGSNPWQTNDNWALLDRHDDANTVFSVAFFPLAGNDLVLQSTTTVVNDTWYHLAVTRSGSTFRLFVNGVEEASYTNTAAVSASSEVLAYVGGTIEGQTASAHGHIDELRVTKGVARYTSNFTPPAEAFADTGGQVQIPYSIDNLDDVDVANATEGQLLGYNASAGKWEPSNFTLNNGDPYFAQVDSLLRFDGLSSGTVAPYPDLGQNPPTQSLGGVITETISKWGTSSLKTDTDAGTQLNLAIDPIRTADFTLEGWFYYDNAERANFAKFLQIGSYSASYDSVILEKNNASATQAKLSLTNSSSLIANTNINTLAVDAWQHIALVRRADEFYVYFDGVKQGPLTAAGFDLEASQITVGRQCKGISDLRFTRGIARYTEDTIQVPLAPFPAAGKNYSIELNDLDDVTVGVPSDGQSLVYAAHLGEWTEGAITTRWLDGGGEQYADKVSLLLNFNGDLVDQTGNHVLTTDGSPGFGAPRYGSNSLSLDGSSYLAINDDATLDFAADFCIEAWVKPDFIPTGSGGMCIMAKRNLVGAGVGTWGIIFGDGVLSFKDLESITSYDVNESLTAGQWQHIAVSRAGGTLRIFIDGVEKGTFPNITRNFSSTEKLRIGRWDSSGSYTFDGLMDDLRITKGEARYTANFTPPIAQLSLDSGDKTPTMPLDVLTDVSAAAPSDGQVLTWVDTNSRWEAVAPGGGGSSLPTPVSASAIALLNFDAATDPSAIGVTSDSINDSMFTQAIPYTTDPLFGAGSGFFGNEGFFRDRIEFDLISGYAFGTTAWTIQFWWKSSETAYTDDDPTAAKYIWSSQSYALDFSVIVKTDSSTVSSDAGETVNGGGSIYLNIGSQFNEDWLVGTTPAATDGAWHHVAFTCSGDDNGSTTYTSFLDGTQIQSVTTATKDLGAAQRHMGLLNGSSNNTGIHGQLDAFAIYDADLYGASDFVPTGAASPTLPADGTALVWDASSSSWVVGGEYLPKSVFQAVVAASTDFADFQSRVAAL